MIGGEGTPELGKAPSDSGLTVYGAREPGTSAQFIDAAENTLGHFREASLRKILRVGCAVGTVGMLSAFLRPNIHDAPSLVMGAIGTAALFSTTYLPARFRILSHVYPWGLTLIGVALTRTMGPAPPGLLLVAGGLFMGSLMLKTGGLIYLSLTATLGLFASAWLFAPPMEPALLHHWSDALSSMASVIVPAAVTGRLLVGTLARSLGEREALVADLTAERQALETVVEDLENTRTQLTHAQKLELISQMAGGIAHDMNNALTTIMGEASMLGDDVALPRERLLESSAHAASLTHQLMIFGRRDTSQPRPLDLSEILRQVLLSIRRLVPSDIAINSELSKEQLVVFADPTHLLQIMMNLAVNAKDAMGKGGKLTLRLHKSPESNQAVIEVSDTGTGISPGVLDQIFDPFFTTKPAGKGTGLGLANVWRLTHEMGGKVGVKSVLGKGTTFTLSLPMTDARVSQPVQQESAALKGTGTILIVDDDIRVRAFVYTALERLGYQVFEASHVSIAVEIARLHRNEIDLLLTDVVMEGGGGAAVIVAVRSEIPELPVLVISGYANDEALRRGITKGEFPFLAKPFTIEGLGEAVQRALSKSSPKPSN